MKRLIILFVITLLFASLLLICKSRIRENAFMESQVEALADDEDISFWISCRCHSDGECYWGNIISFRPLCATLPLDPEGYEEDPCHAFAFNCQ